MRYIGLMRRDPFSGNLFEKPGTNPPELLKPDKSGRNTDKEGNIYDDEGNLIKEKPSPYLERALDEVRKIYPTVGPTDEFVRHLIRKYEREEQKKAEKQHKQKHERH